MLSASFPAPVQFTDESKDRVFNDFPGHATADWENGNPILIIDSGGTIQIVRRNDWILFINGQYYVLPDSEYETLKAYFESRDKNIDPWNQVMPAPDHEDTRQLLVEAKGAVTFLQGLSDRGILNYERLESLKAVISRFPGESDSLTKQ
jgi:hypothetical protein